MWESRHERFPEHTPVNKEYYLLRSLFEERFPGACALNTVPKGLSIACSTPEAVSWDPSWANIHDISGRAVSFHDASDGYDSKSAPVPNGVAGSNGVHSAAPDTNAPRAMVSRAAPQARGGSPCIMRVARPKRRSGLPSVQAVRASIRLR
jgi:asparagine synthase (glutamine-hydrolysing)